MKRIVKSALFISTALLVCSEGGNNILAMQRGTPPPLQPGMQPPQPGAGMPRGGPPQGMQPPQLGVRGGPVQRQPVIQQQVPVPDISPITKLCNECAANIEILLNKKVLTAEVMQKIEMQGGDKEKNIKEFMEPYVLTAKKHILTRIAALLEEEFKYLDQPVPDEGKIIGIVKQSCLEEEEQGSLDRLIAAVVKEQQKEELGETGEKSKKSKKGIQQEEVVEGNIFRKLKKIERGGASTQQSAPQNPFEVILKKTAVEEKKAELTPMQAVEKELEAIQPMSNSEADKKTADRLRLIKIKEFLEANKGAEFVSKFTDPELLAFQLHVIVDLQPEDLVDEREGFEKAGFKHRKFSDMVLEALKNIRFSRDPGTRILAEALTAEQVKTEIVSSLLTNNFQMTRERLAAFKEATQLK